MNKNYSNLVNTQEDKDRYVATKCLQHIFRKFSYNIHPSELTSSVDLFGNISDGNKTVNFKVEIKERNKDQDQLSKYPNCELRVDKYNRMLSQCKDGSVLFYMVLLNQETMYLFNLSKIDVSQLRQFNWRVRRFQMNPNSPYDIYQVFSLPTDLAMFKLDCSKYYQEYANNKQAKEETN